MNNKKLSETFSVAAGVFAISVLIFIAILDLELIPVGALLLTRGRPLAIINITLINVCYLLVAVFSLSRNKLMLTVTAVAAVVESVFMVVALKLHFFGPLLSAVFIAACVSMVAVMVLALVNSRIVRYVFWIPAALFGAFVIRVFILSVSRSYAVGFSNVFSIFGFGYAVMIITVLIFFFSGLWVYFDAKPDLTGTAEE